jgi:4'-phosphopantetheinyl transferase
LGTHWPPGPAHPSLTLSTVHVWRASLLASGEAVDAYESSLAPNERQRANRFIFPRDRQRFIIARGVLRHLLARYAAQPPDQFQFRYGPQGKPELAQDPTLPPLAFNLSHSADLALYAIATERDLGIDLERIRPNLDLAGVAELSFSPTELATLHALPPPDQHLAFFTCWTRKEAFVKARGDGLTLPLKHFDVSLTPDQPAALLYTAWAPDEAERWSLHALQPAAGYVGALAVRGQGWNLKTYGWSHPDAPID